MRPKVSIVIPTFTETDLSHSRFMRLIKSIESQTFDDLEIVIADHSIDGRVETLLQSSPLRIKYIKNYQNLGNSSANTNLGLSMSRGELIQVMHCDDWYSSPDAISLFVQELNRLPGVSWGVFGFDHWDEEANRIYNPIIPSLDRTLGNPSTTFFRQRCTNHMEFDNSLIYINDHDFHQSLLLRFGPPLIIRDICIRIGMSTTNVAQTLSQERILHEMSYFEHKRELQIDNLKRDCKRRMVRLGVQDAVRAEETSN